MWVQGKALVGGSGGPSPPTKNDFLCLRLNKSSGIDDVLNEYIISTKHIFRKRFNLILENGIVPSDWVQGNIISIYKNKVNKNKPNNYRPITLLSCIG